MVFTDLDVETLDYLINRLQDYLMTEKQYQQRTDITEVDYLIFENRKLLLIELQQKINGLKARTLNRQEHTLEINNRKHWINQIKEHTGEKNTYNVIQMALSYTLQACKNNDLDKYKWSD